MSIVKGKHDNSLNDVTVLTLMQSLLLHCDKYILVMSCVHLNYFNRIWCTCEVVNLNSQFVALNPYWALIFKLFSSSLLIEFIHTGSTHYMISRYSPLSVFRKNEFHQDQPNKTYRKKPPTGEYIDLELSSKNIPQKACSCSSSVHLKPTRTTCVSQRILNICFIDEVWWQAVSNIN